MKKLILLLIIFTLWYCKKEEKNDNLSGEVTISSKLYTEGLSYYTYGFSFQENEKIKYQYPDYSSVDLVLVSLTGVDGVIQDVQFESPGNLNAFKLEDTFNNLESAIDYFNDYKTIVNNDFVAQTDILSKYQVWIIKTRNDTYAKIIIKDINIYSDQNRNYGEVTIQWVYQPDGSKTF